MLYQVYGNKTDKNTDRIVLVFKEYKLILNFLLVHASTVKQHIGYSFHGTVFLVATCRIQTSVYLTHIKSNPLSLK